MPKTTTPKNSGHAGFTIIELMIAVAVLGVLAGIGAPALGTFSKNAALRNQTYDMMSSIALARSESIKRGSRVILCRTANPNAGTPSCGGSDKDWATGWLLFVAGDTDNDFDVGTDVLVKVGMPADNLITVRSNGTGNNYLVFNADGTLNETGAAQYVLCDDRGTSNGRQIDIALVGRPAITKGSRNTPLTTCTPTG